jgi:hypothetical protein
MAQRHQATDCLAFGGQDETWGGLMKEEITTIIRTFAAVGPILGHALKSDQLIGTAGALIDGVAPFDFVFEAQGATLHYRLPKCRRS